MKERSGWVQGNCVSPQSSLSNLSFNHRDFNIRPKYLHSNFECKGFFFKLLMRTYITVL